MSLLNLQGHPAREDHPTVFQLRPQAHAGRSGAVLCKQRAIQSAMLLAGYRPQNWSEKKLVFLHQRAVRAARGQPWLYWRTIALGCDLELDWLAQIAREPTNEREPA